VCNQNIGSRSGSTSMFNVDLRVAASIVSSMCCMECEATKLGETCEVQAQSNIQIKMLGGETLTTEYAARAVKDL
jgi:hypothetical protein